MFKFILQRFVGALGSLLGLSLVVYGALTSIPGSVVGSILGAEGASSPESIAQLEEKFGLDRPWFVRFLEWLAGVATGDFGVSWLSEERVLDLILERLTLTAEIALLALFVSCFLGLILGVIAAAWQNRWPDQVVRIFGLIGATVPVYVSATLLLLIGSSYFGWIPPTGYISISEDFIENLRLVVAPALILGITSASGVTRIVRASVADALGQEYVRTARAKGLKTSRILFLHALRNAAIPIVTVIGVEAGVLLSGAVVTETILSLPGVGRLTVDAILQRDYPVAQGSILFIGGIFVIINFLIDLLYGFLDPRTRIQGRVG